MLKKLFARRATQGETQAFDEATELAPHVDRLERAFASEMTGSMSLNIRATGLVAISVVGILLIVEFSSTWLDDNRWKFPSGLADFFMQAALTGAIGAFVVTLGFAAYAAWPKRRWAGMQSERLRCLSQGNVEQSARLLLQMVEKQRATNERKSVALQFSAVPTTVAIFLVIVQAALFTIDAEPVDPAREGLPEEVQELPTEGLPSKEEQARLAGVYAPRVWLHRSDRWGPLDPREFIKGSRLVWKLRRNSQVVAKGGKVSHARLGSRCGNSCYQVDGFLARELTRPFESTGRPRGLKPGRGFALEPNDAAQHGQHGREPDVPMLYEVRRVGAELRINYWLFYGYSRPHNPAVAAIGDTASHDGDWENVEVGVDPGDATPLAVYFYGHGAPKRVPWKDVCKVGAGVDDCASEEPGHPVVYSALDSHASYEKAGRVVVHGDLGNATDITAAGWRWEAWDKPNGLRRAQDGGWWGFGGAWGRARDIPGTTGPLGPSRWKLPSSPDPGDLRAAP